MKNLRSLLVVVGLCCLASPTAAFVQADLDRTLQTNECRKCDLSGANLAGMDLTKAKLEGANLSRADLSKASLRMADLAGASLAVAMLSGAVLEAADLFQANLKGASVEGAIFDGAYLAEATMDEGQQVRFAKANLTTSVPRVASPLVEGGAAPSKIQASAVGPEAALDETAETSPPAAMALDSTSPQPGPEAEPVPSAGGPATKVPTARGKDGASNPVAQETTEPTSPASAQDAAKAPATLEEMLKRIKSEGICVECNFSGMDLGGLSLKGAILERANFSGAQLAEASFKEANLKGANFRGAKLKGAVFKGADLYQADFSGSDLSDANFQGAVLDGVTFGDATVTGALFDEDKK